MSRKRTRSRLLRTAMAVLWGAAASTIACGGDSPEGLAPGADIPIEQAAAMSEKPDVHIVDVRTEAEFAFVGHPAGAVNIPLLRFDPETYGTTPNPDFVEQVKMRFSPDETLLMICRSGGRSARAAKLLAEAGYAKVYNVLEGVEGDTDADGHRSINGWKVRGYPYEYNVRPEETTPAEAPRP